MSHQRISSQDERRRIAIPRRSTKGPLDAVDDDPLASPAPQPPTPSRVLSPTRTPHPHDAFRSSPSTALDTPPKDFSFLQDPSAYHALPASNVPAPFLNAPNTPSVSSPIDTLLLSGHFRLAAIASARNLLACAPTDSSSLFHLLHIRLACLVLISEHALAAQEARVLGDLNASVYYVDDGGRRRGIVPWELRVLVVRLAALGYGEWRRGVMGYYELGRECRENIVAAVEEEEKALWRARLKDVGIRVANVLVEMGDLEGACRHLATLDEGEGEQSRELAVMQTLIYLRLGDIRAARRCLARLVSALESDPLAADSPGSDIIAPTLTALTHLAEADYPTATSAFRILHERFPDDAMVTQNLAVCLLYSGRVSEAKELLLRLVDESQPFHSLVFNLSTVYELCTERNREGKLALAAKVAGRKGEGGVGWEMGNADFKL